MAFYIAILIMQESFPTYKLNENGTFNIEGDFNFTTVNGVFYENFQTFKQITFKFNPEIIMDLQTRFSTDECVEIIAEKLKQDFIKLLKTRI